MKPAPIVFYDSDCGLCKGTVRFVLRHERTAILQFAPITGETAQQAGISPELGGKTIVVIEDGQQFIRSRAARRVLQAMGGGWKILAQVMAIVPPPVADVIYRGISANRRRFRESGSCLIPSAETRSRFLP